MRWVVVTPTFAVGLGIVVAAAMAAPTGSVVLSMKPYVGKVCPAGDCGGTGNGTLASRPGTRRLVVPARVPTPAPGTGHGRSVSATGGAGRMLVQYRTSQAVSGRSAGLLTIASRTGQPLGSWTLTVSFPASDQIQQVWAGTSLPHGPHSATVTSGQLTQAGNGWGGWQGGHAGQIVFVVSGPSAAPASCTINGQSCQLTVVQGGQGYGGGGSGGGGNYGGEGGYGG
jgi:hypothetical protein